MLLAWPAFINTSATQSQWAAIFRQKATTTVCLGFYINSSSMFSHLASTQVAARIRHFEVKEDDIWIATFPKCGTTWTQVKLQLFFIFLGRIF